MKEDIKELTKYDSISIKAKTKQKQFMVLEDWWLGEQAWGRLGCHWCFSIWVICHFVKIHQANILFMQLLVDITCQLTLFLKLCLYIKLFMLILRNPFVKRQTYSLTGIPLDFDVMIWNYSTNCYQWKPFFVFGLQSRSVAQAGERIHLNKENLIFYPLLPSKLSNFFYI